MRKMRFRGVSEHKMFPNFLVMLQYTLLLVLMVFNLDFPIKVTGATVQSGFKVIMFSHILIFVFSIFTLVSFYARRNKGTAEKGILVLSALTGSVSFASILLRMVNGLFILMVVSQILSWTLFSVTFSVNVYKALGEALNPEPKRLDAFEHRASSFNKKP